jgi:putative membrane protein
MVALLEPLVPIAIGIVYAIRVAKLSKIGRAPSTIRQIAFLTGLVIIAITSIPPLSTLSGDLVSGHMVTHTLLTDEASLLFAIGLTGPVLGPILSAPGLSWFRKLTHPAAVLALWIFTVYFWHIPAMYQAAGGEGALHLIEHASFLFAGTMLWMTVLGTFPTPSWFGVGQRVALVVIAHLSMMVLANVLMWSGTAYYPEYEATAIEHGFTSISDQGLAGVILMIQGSAVMLSVFFWALLRWARVDTEKHELLDYARGLGVELDEQRAARAAASGHGANLRRRIEQTAARPAAAAAPEPGPKP